MRKDIIKKIVDTESVEEIKKIVEQLQGELFMTGGRIYNASDLDDEREAEKARNAAFCELCEVNTVLGIAMCFLYKRFEGMQAK